MKRISCYSFFSTVLALVACGFSTYAYAYTREQFAAVSADEYAVCADVNAKYDDGSDKWSADIDILVSNISGEELPGMVPLAFRRMPSWICSMRPGSYER